MPQQPDPTLLELPQGMFGAGVQYRQTRYFGIPLTLAIQDGSQQAKKTEINPNSIEFHKVKYGGRPRVSWRLSPDSTVVEYPVEVDPEPVYAEDLEDIL